jgi:addiction module HigA family antidote
VILSFVSKDTERLFLRERVKKFIALERVALRKLAQLHAVTLLSDLASPPGNHLEALKHERQGRHSIRINDQWRICFRWHEGNAYDVEIVDYH